MNTSSVPHDMLQNKTSPAEPAAARGEVHGIIHMMGNVPPRHLFHAGLTEVGVVFPPAVIFNVQSP